MKERKQSTTTYPICFLMCLSSDHITGATGITPTVTIRKAGGAFAAPAGAVTEIANGWYQLAGNATDRDTLGELLLHATEATCDPADEKYVIVPYDPFDGVSLGLSSITEARLAELDAANLPADVLAVFNRIGAPAGASIAADLVVIDNFVDDLETRITAARAGYLDELAAANIPADVDTLISRLTAARAGYIDELGAANIPADVDTLLTRLTALRAGYLDNLSGGAVALASGVVVSDKTGFSLSAAGIDDIIDEVIEGTETLRQLLRLMRAALLGISSGGGTFTRYFRDLANAKDRITATVDSDGNRTVVTPDGT